MKLSKVHTVLLISMLLFGGVVFSSVTNPVFAQSTQPTNTPTPNPTIVALEEKINTQQTQIDSLSQKLEDETRDRTYYDRDIQWKWGILAAVSAAVASILTWVGRNNLKALQQDWELHSQRILDKAIYKLDIGNLPIYLPTGENLENIYSFLQQRKFFKIQFYEQFEDVKYGILIVSLKSKDENQRNKLYETLREFMKTHAPSVSKFGFIIYAPERVDVPKDVMTCHDNLVTANYPVTVISSIFTVGRGIEIAPSEGGQSK